MFVDFKCNECGVVSEYYVKSNDLDKIKCESCGSKNMTRVFAPVCSKRSSSSDDNFLPSSSSSGKSCSGSCSGCSGCSR
ncbi:MAG: zinc ribbon domain-containing protein [Actinomycetota bacterium]|nr:zinc ribbon domain-containing protein [Actinomycetota bacterium]